MGHGAEIHVPAAFPSLFKTRWDWDFDSESEPGLGGRRAYLPRGRMVGGSSSMNADGVHAGQRGRLRRLGGRRGAGMELPGRPAVLHALEDNERGADDYHGVGGPLHLSDSRAMSRVVDAYVEAAVEAGCGNNHV